MITHIRVFLQAQILINFKLILQVRVFPFISNE